MHLLIELFLEIAITHPWALAATPVANQRPEATATTAMTTAATTTTTTTISPTTVRACTIPCTHSRSPPTPLTTHQLQRAPRPQWLPLARPRARAAQPRHRRRRRRQRHSATPTPAIRPRASTSLCQLSGSTTIRLVIICK